jgi:transcriptional regulator of acetoin/glycerol metabolism
MQARATVSELRKIRDQLLERRDVAEFTTVRPEVASAWRRCITSGVRPDSLAPFYVGTDQAEGELVRAATPVLSKLYERLSGSSVSMLLADRNGLVVRHWAGTKQLLNHLDKTHATSGFLVDESISGNNGIGTVLEEGRPVSVEGAEHFADIWLDHTCVGTPIRHPITRQLKGVLNLTCRAPEANDLMLPFVLEAAQAIERRWYLESSRSERHLLEHFLSAEKRGSRPIIVLNEEIVISNAAAARVLDEVGQAQLWEYAASAIEDPHAQDNLLPLRDGGSVSVRCRRLEDGRAAIGALIEIGQSARAPRAKTAGRIRATQGVSDDRTESWRALWAQARSARMVGLPLLVTGEPGVGKMTLVEDVLRTEDGPRPHVFDAARQPLDGISLWVGAVESALCVDSDSVVVLRHLECLEDQAVRALASIIDTHEINEKRLVGTLTHHDGSTPVGPLIDRMAVAPVRIPALRQRTAELASLIGALTRKHAPQAQVRWRPDAIQTLARLDWPGNVRQLDNLVRRVLATRRAEDIGARDLPEEIRGQAPRRRLSEMERAELGAITSALQQAGGNKRDAADMLGVSRATLYRKIRSYGIGLDRTNF